MATTLDEAVPEGEQDGRGTAYKWIALSNTTLGILMVTINQSILLIALPAIFRGIKLNPLAPSNTSYFLWMLMGFILVTAVLVVSLGRVGDIYGRVKMYNLGFAVFTIFSVLLWLTPLTGSAGALWIVIGRVLQGVGAAFLFANSSAIITDAFPSDQRGRAIGINSVAAIGGAFIGLLLGGALSPITSSVGLFTGWRLVFLVSVPFGLFGTVWAYMKLRDNGVRRHARIDWWGNLAFAAGLILILVGIVYALNPYGGHTMGWTNPFVLACVIAGLVILASFVWIETKVPEPMFRLQLFRIRAFAAGNIAVLLAAVGRGGLQFLLIIWLQGIWLPQHGYSFSETPLWAGIYMIPLTIGFLVAAPISGVLADRFGARPFATGGLLITVVAFILLELLPINFSYIWFALVIFVFALGTGMFSAPNQTGIMNSLPPEQRGAGAGMFVTFQNAASVLSIGVFFTVLTLGISSALPAHLYAGLHANGISGPDALRASRVPPIGSLFAAFLGINPITQLVPAHALAALTPAQHALLTSRHFFPSLLGPAFAKGLHLALDFAAVASLVGAVASLLRGGRYVHGEAEPELELVSVAPVSDAVEVGKESRA